MKLMLGVDSRPYLLVKVTNQRSSEDFDFEVVNGLWKGAYLNGTSTVHQWGKSLCSPNKLGIICDNQDRLRGNYQTVFDNFHDEKYVASNYNVTLDVDDICY
jgi:hypothetical protein